jgi:hypothetical protein
MPNLATGFWRLTCVASALLSLPWLLFAFGDSANIGLWLILLVIGASLPWIVYYVGGWVARGFQSAESKVSGTPVPAVPQIEAAPSQLPTECPRCGLVHPPGTAKCDCGFELRGERLTIRPIGRGLWVWAIIVAILGAGGLAITAYELLTAPNAKLAGEAFRQVVSIAIWANLSVRVADRQILSPRWFWITAGTVSGAAVVVPLWHHGREWKSRGRMIAGWSFFVFALAMTAFAVVVSL